MPQVNALLIGRKPRALDLPEDLTVKDLNERLRDIFEIEEVRVVFKGKTLSEEGQSVQFTGGETLLVTVPQKLPTAFRQQDTSTDPDADITFHLPPSASPLKKWLYRFVSEKLRFPNIVLYWIFSIRPLYYALFALWIILSPVAARYELGPIYIIGTIFLLIVVNLGVRREGELSGYSIFNENVRSLPGQLQADQLDQQIRHGQM